MRGCKQTWSLSNHSVSLRLLYFPHCRPFDSNLSPLNTSHRWRNNSKTWPNLGFLLPLFVPLLGQWMKAVKVLGMTEQSDQSQVAWFWEILQSWIHKITCWSWLCSVQIHLKQRIVHAPLLASHKLWWAEVTLYLAGGAWCVGMSCFHVGPAALSPQKLWIASLLACLA